MNIWIRVLTITFWSLLANYTLALPEFSGARADDLPLSESLLATVSSKNMRENVLDIDSVVMGSDMMLIRIYAGFGDVVFADGRYPLDLYEVRFRDNVLTTLLKYPACETGMQSASGSLNAIAQTFFDYRFFDIRDTRADPANSNTRDGTSYLIQIRTSDAQREFLISNPDNYESGDSQRFRAVLATLANEFGEPDCHNFR